MASDLFFKLLVKMLSSDVCSQWFLSSANIKIKNFVRAATFLEKTDTVIFFSSYNPAIYCITYTANVNCVFPPNGLPLCLSKFLFPSRFNISIHAKCILPLFRQFSVNLFIFFVYVKILVVFIHKSRIYQQHFSEKCYYCPRSLTTK